MLEVGKLERNVLERLVHASDIADRLVWSIDLTCIHFDLVSKRYSWIRMRAIQLDLSLGMSMHWYINTLLKQAIRYDLFVLDGYACGMISCWTENYVLKWVLVEPLITTFR